MKTKGYSLWIIPKGRLYKKLSKIINQLSIKYSSASFIPHVTLIGGIEGTQDRVIDQTKRLAGLIKPYVIELTGYVHCEEHWTKAMFVEVRETEAVLHANKYARTVFELDSNDSYTPHLSLMYSDSITLEKRLEVARKFKQGDFRDMFPIEEIHLYGVEGKVEDWVKIAEFKLTG